MTEQELMIVENEMYLGRPINRDIVTEFADTLNGVHPQAGELGTRGLRTLAELALVTGANPLPGTNGIHVFMDKGKIAFDFGIGFWRSQVEMEGGILWIFRPRPMTEDEREYYGVIENQTASICSAALKRDLFGLMREAREFGIDMSLRDAKEEIGRIGSAIVDNSEYKKKGRTHQWTADKRAEKDLLRQLVPLMNRARQNAVDGTQVQGGLDWSVGEYAHLQNGEQLPDDYNIQDANGDLYDDEPPVDVDVETGEIVEADRETPDDEPPADYEAPLPDDEQTIVEAPGAEFFTVTTALIDRFTHENHTKNAAKKLEVDAIPGKPDDRRLLYLRLKEYARARDEEEAQEKPAKKVAGAFDEVD